MLFSRIRSYSMARNWLLYYSYYNVFCKNGMNGNEFHLKTLTISKNQGERDCYCIKPILLQILPESKNIRQEGNASHLALFDVDAVRIVTFRKKQRFQILLIIFSQNAENECAATTTAFLEIG